MSSEEKRISSGQAYDSQVLLSMADYLITDYSSCLFDFLVTDRPIIQFLYDYDYYLNDDRGLYYSKEEMDCGHIVLTEQGMKAVLEEVANSRIDTSQKQIALKQKMMTFESESNSECIYNAIRSDLQAKKA